MKTVIGNLIILANAGHFDVIVHGCNCMGVMGAGLARSIKDAYPEAYNVYMKSNKTLGSISYAQYTNLIIVNACTQFGYGRTGLYTNYDAVRTVFKSIKHMFSGKRIGLPQIGAGLGGGDWNIISKIIDEELQGENCTIVKLY